MNNPFNLNDEQINELGKYMLGYCVGKSWGQYARDVLTKAERMAKENAQSAFTVDWSNVPPEYGFAAVDTDGRIMVYVREPSPHKNLFWGSGGINYKHIGYSKAVADGKIDWRTTLRQRPNTHAKITFILSPELDPEATGLEKAFLQFSHGIHRLHSFCKRESIKCPHIYEHNFRDHDFEIIKKLPDGYEPPTDGIECPMCGVKHLILRDEIKAISITTPTTKQP